MADSSREEIRRIEDLPFVSECGYKFYLLGGIYAVFDDDLNHDLISYGDVFQLGRCLCGAIYIFCSGLYLDDREVAGLLFDFDEVANDTIHRTHHEFAVWSLREAQSPDAHQ